MLIVYNLNYDLCFYKNQNIREKTPVRNNKVKLNKKM